MEQSSKPKTWSWLLLFTTSGTLICCAIPITLVSLGMGATVASMAATAPWLVALSMHKGWVFGLSAGLIALSAWSVYRPGRACPIDPELAAACARADNGHVEHRVSCRFRTARLAIRLTSWHFLFLAI